MMTQTGTLPVGVEYDGKTHRDFVLRPHMVRDPVDVLDAEPRAAKNDAFMGVCMMARQIQSLGDIPKEAITPALVMDMYDVDSQVLMEAKGALDRRLRTFRGTDEGGADTDAGAA